MGSKDPNWVYVVLKRHWTFEGLHQSGEVLFDKLKHERIKFVNRRILYQKVGRRVVRTNYSKLIFSIDMIYVRECLLI